MSRYKVLCLGDFILDVWWSVDTAAKNVEHAAMALVSLPEQKVVSPGGVGIVARALAALQVTPAVVTTLDTTISEDLITQKLTRKNVVTHLIRYSRKFTTPVKTRYINANGHILMRHDAENPVNCDTAYDADYVLRHLKDAECLTISDYGKGCIPAIVRAHIVSAAASAGKPVYVDAKPAYFERYTGADVFKINKAEFSNFAAAELRANSIEDAIQLIAQRLQTALLIVTDGSAGAYYCHNYQTTCFMPAPASYRAGNCVGAGDVFFAGIVFGFSQLGRYRPARMSDNDIFKIIQFGLATAGEYVKHGTTSFPEPKPVLRSVHQRNVPDRRLLSVAELIKFAAEQREAGRQIVFTNGCFDLLHSGHIALLTAAKREGDILLVAVDSDDNVRRLKGPDRPIQDANTRAGNISALDVVDAVCVFQDTEQNTHLEDLVKQVAPNVLVKGADYSDKPVVGSDFLSRQNPPGRVVLVPLVPNSSTTAFVNKMKAATL